MLPRSLFPLLLAGCFKKPDTGFLFFFSLFLFSASLRIKVNDGYKSVARYQNVMTGGILAFWGRVALIPAHPSHPTSHEYVTSRHKYAQDLGSRPIRFKLQIFLNSN